MGSITGTGPVTAIIVTYNGSAWISKCLNSLRSSAQPVDVIVVDNGSSDETLEIIENEFSESVRLIRSERNLGFGGGNNIAMRMAIEDGAEFVFLLNQDAWVEPQTIEKLVAQARLHTNYGVISPIHLNGAGTLLDKPFQEHICSTERQLVTDSLTGALREFYEVKFVNAAAWLVRADCIKKVGFFDPIFFHYGEDANFVDRCRFFGFKIGLHTKSFIWHDREERATSNIIDRKYSFEKLRTGWLGNVTDPNVENWEESYYLQLLRYTFRNSFTSATHFRKFLSSMYRLGSMKREISIARDRMQQGFDAYR